MSVSIQSTAIVGACTQIYSQSVKLTDILVMASMTALSRQNSHCLQHSEESETHFSQHCGYKFIRYALYHFSEHINQIGLCRKGRDCLLVNQNQIIALLACFQH